MNEDVYELDAEDLQEGFIALRDQNAELKAKVKELGQALAMIIVLQGATRFALGKAGREHAKALKIVRIELEGGAVQYEAHKDPEAPMLVIGEEVAE